MSTPTNGERGNNTTPADTVGYLTGAAHGYAGRAGLDPRLGDDRSYVLGFVDGHLARQRMRRRAGHDNRNPS